MSTTIPMPRHAVCAGLLSIASAACYTPQRVGTTVTAALAPVPVSEVGDIPLRLRLDDGSIRVLRGAHYRNDSIVGFTGQGKADQGPPTVIALNRVVGLADERERGIYVMARRGGRVTVYRPVVERRMGDGPLAWLAPSDSVPFLWTATDVEPEYGIALADVTRVEVQQLDTTRSAGIALLGVGVVLAVATTVALISVFGAPDCVASC